MSTGTLERPETFAFRSAPTAGGHVDHQARIIRGFVVAQLGEARTHGIELDEATLDQIVALGNAQPAGVKSRFGHPSPGAGDAIGRFVGRTKNFRRAGGQVLADLHLDGAAETSPHGDLANYLMKLAQNDRTAYGASIVFTGRREARNGQRPVLRIDTLSAVDFVDDPAATSGMFSTIGTTAADASAVPWMFSGIAAQQEQERRAELAASLSTRPTLADDDFRREFAADRKRLEARGMSEEDFILSRRVDAGIESLDDQVRRKRMTGSAL